jgi:hypothetical protein
MVCRIYGITSNILDGGYAARHKESWQKGMEGICVALSYFGSTVSKREKFSRHAKCWKKSDAAEDDLPAAPAKLGPVQEVERQSKK